MKADHHTCPPPEPLRTRRFAASGLLGWAVLALALGGCALPRWPVDARVTSPFGVRFPGLLPAVHHGVDLDVPVGTPVRSSLPGTVRFAGTMTGYGRVIWVEHVRGALTVYAHLDRIGVRAGDAVGAGAVIGHSGRSGNVTGPHLHFEVWKGGRPVDPVSFLGSRPHTFE